MSAARRPRRRGVLLLGAGCAVLAVLVYYELGEPAQSRLPEARQAAVVALADILPAEPELDMPPPERFAAILERPLFSPSRRPPIAPAEPAQTLAPLPDFALMGVVISDEGRLALLHAEGVDGIVRIGEGEDLAGWRLVRIDRDRVLFRRGDREHAIALDFDAPPPPGARRTPRRETAGRDKGSTQPNQAAGATPQAAEGQEQP